jgi:putative FmdB family regulatory protein
LNAFGLIRIQENLTVPTYEYVCANCKNRTEVVQSFSDPPLTTCALCGGELRRVFYPATIQFKGSGFYSTDNRRPGGSVKPKAGEKTADGATTAKSGDKAGEASTSGAAAKTAEKSA